MMTRDVKYGLIFVALAAASFALLLLVVFYGRQYGIKSYPRYIIPITTMLPLFFVAPFATRFLRVSETKLTRKEVITFGTIATLGSGLAAYVAEAHFLYTALAQSDNITFREILFAPLDKRYSIGVLFGMSFGASATLVAAFVAFIRIPATISARLYLAQKARNDADNNDR